MDVEVGNTKHLEGVVTAPSSKAYTHRMLIAALLSDGSSKLRCPLVSADTKATLEAVKAFGAETELHKNYWLIHGQETLKTPKKPIDCKESGSTLRFMIPIAALASGPSMFLFEESFKRRPIAPLLRSLRDLGVESSVQKDISSVIVQAGGINGGRTSIRGDISSQFISGLLFVCPKAKNDTEISLTTELESKKYVDMTLEVLVKHGIEGNVNSDFTHLRIPARQSYKPCDHTIPGDFSSAAFLLAAAAITSSKVTVKNLQQQTLQGDKEILDILQKMGAIVTIGKDSVTIENEKLVGIDVDAMDIPDLVPILAVLACYGEGFTEIYNAKRLKYKESNRLESISTELRKMGAEIKEKENGLTINGPCKLQGANINPCNDHRIAMACAVAALGASKRETKIQDAECINKSYPQFFTDLRALGANIVGI